MQNISEVKNSEKSTSGKNPNENRQ